MDRLTVYIHDLGQGDACIVAVARLVSLWRNTCNYNGAHAAFLYHVRQSCFFVIMQNFLWTTKFLEGVDTGEASRFVTFFFEVAGYNCGQMRTQKWFRLTDPILVPSLYLGTEIGSAGRTLNRPLQKSAFLPFKRCWNSTGVCGMDRFNCTYT